MADNDHSTDDNTAQTLATLDQLSQTLEVMSCVVERLRHQVHERAALRTDSGSQEETALEEEESDEEEEALTVEMHRLRNGSADPTIH